MSKTLARTHRATTAENSPLLDVLAAKLIDVTTMDEALGLVVSFAVEALDLNIGGVSLQRGEGIETVAATHESVVTADHLQHKLQEGPLFTPRSDGSLWSYDLATDSRWPLWGAEASALDLHSVISAEIRGRGDEVGALNLYGEPSARFDDHDFALAHMFARQASVALAFARNEAHLMKALDNRSVVGQAQGILMERYDIDADRAFTVLRRYSMDTNTRLRLLAEDVVAGRVLREGSSR